MIAVLHNIRSAHNVGSIFRTADAVGIEKLYLCGITPAPVDEYGRPHNGLTKVSLGAEQYIAWEKVHSTARTLDALKIREYTIFAIEQNKKAVPYYRLTANGKKRKVALVMGGEVKGLPKSILSRADTILEIPMYGRKESLNVAVAFGVVAFYFTERIWRK